MSDIFDEDTSLSHVEHLVHKLHEKYVATLHGDVQPDMPSNLIREHTSMALHWPGDEMVQRIIIDAVRLMVKHNIDLTDFTQHYASR